MQFGAALLQETAHGGIGLESDRPLVGGLASAVVTKPGGTRTPCWTRFPHHFAERRILPAPTRNIVAPQMSQTRSITS
jgi:hypothetical protein